MTLSIVDQPGWLPDAFGLSYYRDEAPDQPGTGTAPHFDPLAGDLRNQIINRLLGLNLRHTLYAWQQRRSQPVAPHALAFFYAEPVQPAGYEVVAATRLFDAAPRVRHLATLLYRLTSLVRDRYATAPGRFDPRRQLCNRADRMSAAARYLGIGVSSLDSDVTWERAQRMAADARDVSGRCVAVLADGGQVLVKRGARQVFDRVSVWSTRNLNVAPHRASRSWAWATPEELSYVAGLWEVWPQLTQLHALALEQSPGAAPLPPAG